ncbi:hypothetical protein BDZ45DRAFT_425839 [Acephala macrosclerotiorum]|nr:hypothetical protein BDZ45DRAFT_425839 [Acephala macrosclerotiorum]
MDPSIASTNTLQKIEGDDIRDYEMANASDNDKDEFRGRNRYRQSSNESSRQCAGRARPVNKRDRGRYRHGKEKMPCESCSDSGSSLDTTISSRSRDRKRLPRSFFNSKAPPQPISRLTNSDTKAQREMSPSTDFRPSTGYRGNIGSRSNNSINSSISANSSWTEIGWSEGNDISMIVDQEFSVGSEVPEWNGSLYDGESKAVEGLGVRLDGASNILRAKMMKYFVEG